MLLTLLLFGASIIVKAQISDNVAGHEPIVVPENIQSLLQQITEAENNEDWDSYYQLREQIIQSWQQVNPEVASIYKRKIENDAINYNGAPQAVNRSYGKLNNDSFWGNDLMVHAGDCEDISLVSANGDTLYLGVLQRNYGTSNDTVYIYRSANGGNNWTLFSQLNYPSETAQIELLDFYWPGSPTYLLLFSRYTPSGRIWVTRFSPSGSFENFIAVSDSVRDFAVDRNYPASNYRAIMLFDSSGVIHSIRSEPSSYGSVWQDNTSLNTFGVDIDMAYGYTGSVYATFNGKNTGNLYVWPNYNFADPTGWLLSSRVTIEQGSTDTTKQAEVIASRQDTASQTVVAVYTHITNGTENLRWASKTGGSGWSTQMSWVTNSVFDFKHTNLYCRKLNGNDIFQGVFVRSELNNFSPRQIRYKKYESGSWTTSIQVSDDGIDATGIQNSVVIQLPSGDAAFAFAGNIGLNVYFDREDWISNIQVDVNKIPDKYSLSQNYPNPFNPSTTIKYSVPEQSFVKIKVFNLLGQEIAELVNKELQTGNYEVSFDATNFPSGIYFYRIEADNFVQTKKMILMK